MDIQLFKSSLILIGVLAGLGIFMGLAIAFIAKKYSIKNNPLIDEVDEELPKGQCGACGYAGCRQYAEAVVLNPDIPANLCIPGGELVAKMVARLTGKSVGAVTNMKATLLCGASKDLNNCVMTHKYDGIDDCLAASLLYAGDKACEYGCLGYGNCERVCPYDAITLDERGLPNIDLVKCVGCGICVAECPRRVLKLFDANSVVVIRCSNEDKGARTMKICTAGCIGCGLCAKACPHAAIKVENNLAKVNFNICTTVCKDPVCLTAKCRPQTIRPYLKQS